MKGYRFIASLACALLVCTGSALAFTKWDINVHAQGGLAADVGEPGETTGDCWNRPFGFHCTMLVGRTAKLYFKKEHRWCFVTLKREGDFMSGRWDVFAHSGTLNCRIHKLGDNDFGVEPTS